MPCFSTERSLSWHKTAIAKCTTWFNKNYLTKASCVQESGLGRREALYWESVGGSSPRHSDGSVPEKVSGPVPKPVHAAGALCLQRKHMNFSIVSIVHFHAGGGGSCNNLSYYLASDVSCSVSLLAIKKLIVALWCGSGSSPWPSPSLFLLLHVFLTSRFMCRFSSKQVVSLDRYISGWVHETSYSLLEQQ